MIKENDGMIIFVTIGVPFSRIPIMQKVMLFVDTESQTVIQAAKALRKQVADNIENHGWVKGTNFTPEELYYDIYSSVNSTGPFAMSINSPSTRVEPSTWYQLGEYYGRPISGTSE